jgi:hypothetical protein
VSAQSTYYGALMTKSRFGCPDMVKFFHDR